VNFDFEKLENSSSPCYLIAEIGVNHGGDAELAMRMIASANAAGASGVKFQTFTADAFVSRSTPKVLYQEQTTSLDESHYEMIRKLELKREDHVPIMEYCDRLGIDFISTPYDLDSASFLNGIGVNLFKTASADIVDLPLQEYLARTGKPVIVSTGMATYDEIETAVSVYRSAGNRRFSLLHCVSNYPCSDGSLNMRVIPGLRSSFRTLVGFSDHSLGNNAAVVAIAFGAKIIEKHFTLDRNMPGPDHRASVTPVEFAELVHSVRRAENMLGTSKKICQDEEKQMAEVSRKSVFLRKDLPAGECLTMEYIIMKRPGTGIMARDLPEILGKNARSDLPEGHQLKREDLQ